MGLTMAPRSIALVAAASVVIVGSIMVATAVIVARHHADRSRPDSGIASAARKETGDEGAIDGGDVIPQGDLHTASFRFEFAIYHLRAARDAPVEAKRLLAGKAIELRTKCQRAPWPRRRS
jgi:hypothetical protein